GGPVDRMSARAIAAGASERAGAGEAPARCPVRLLHSDAVGRVECEAVEVPGRRSRAWGAVRRGERITVDRCFPTTLAVARREPFERRRVGHPARRPFEDEVQARDADRDGTRWIRREVLRLARAGPAHDI